MKKKIAIPTQNGKLSSEITESTLINLFELENNYVVGAKQEKVGNMAVKNVFLWLSSQDVNEFYVENISNDQKEKLLSLGISVKTKQELTDNNFFNCFAFC